MAHAPNLGQTSPVARRIVTPEGAALTVPREDRQWFRHAVGDTTTHIKAVSYAKLLLQNAASQHSKNRARENIYEGRTIAANGAAVAALDAVGITIARLNAVKSIIDTFVSRLAKDRPMPNINVDGANWKLKQQSKKFRQFIVNKMEDTEFDELSRDALLDGGILGSAFTRIDDGECDVFAERILVNEMLFDERECKYGKPRQAFRVYRMARDHLAELYPQNQSMIKIAPCSIRRPGDNQTELASMNLEDYVDVYDGWDLPMLEDGEDGRYGTFIENATLEYGAWLEPRFPWSMLRLFKPREGLFGCGFVDQLASLQHRVNCIVRDLQLNLTATGRGHFLVNENNDIPTEMLTGWQPFKLKYKGGTPPTYVTPQPFNQAQLNALEYFINKMYDLTGVSQASATSKSALGAGASGIALDTQYDIDSDRFRMPQSNYARYRLDGGQCYIDGAARVARRRAAEKGTKRSYVATSWKDRDEIARLEWDKVALKRAQYRLRIEAVNFLPDERAGKLAIVEQLAKAGIIEQWLVPTLFDEPDLVQANGIILAAFKNCMRKMGDLMDEDLPMPIPEPYNDLDLELKVSTAYYNQMQEERAPDIIQDRFRQYVDMTALAIEEKNKQMPLPPGSVAPGAAPMAPAEAPLPGGVPQMPVGPVPAPAMIGATPQ